MSWIERLTVHQRAIPLPEAGLYALSLCCYSPPSPRGFLAREARTMDANLRLSLVIPAFNEEAVIEQAVSEAESTLGKHFAAFEILVVDDGSSDRTVAKVGQLLRLSPHTRLLRHPANRGYGAALRTGFEAAKFDLIAFTDADCQFDLADLGMLARLATEHSIVAGYRVDRKDVWRRRFFSWGYNVLARTLLGTRVRDCDCALKVFRRADLARILPESQGFFVNTEMLSRARQLGLPVVEHPVTHRPRLGGVSKVSLREIPRTAKTLLTYWWKNVVLRPKASPVEPAQHPILSPALYRNAA